MFVTFSENRQLARSNRLFESTGVVRDLPSPSPKSFDLQELSRTFSDTEIVEQGEILW
ncbi:hypothetical protein ARMGADRAFT_1018300 [Armillaria gallica]|uniref:Uncharacterized protein n=1 Tax=Armillaria gallica TaxID=47427 RepID=A0A2H3D9H0_ARMGA|nr:hypothetical protein ARMGADRAFT_1018300 [Armillaria gallica]